MASVFAIIETGGKQYSISPGSTITVEKMSDDHKEGDKVVFDRVLLADDGSLTTLGTPHLATTRVHGTITKIGRTPKITVTHYKSKSRYWKRIGHRQPYVTVTIDSVS